jgi:hypothetical protein
VLSFDGYEWAVPAEIVFLFLLQAYNSSQTLPPGSGGGHFLQVLNSPDTKEDVRLYITKISVRTEVFLQLSNIT